MGSFSRCLLFFAKFLLSVVINFLGEEAPQVQKKKSKSSRSPKHRQQTTTECPSSEQTTKTEIRRLRRENKDLRRELVKKKLEHAHVSKWSRKDGRLTSSWSETLDRNLQSPITPGLTYRPHRCSTFENEAVSRISFDSGVSSNMSVDKISSDTFEEITLPTVESTPDAHHETIGLDRITTNEDFSLDRHSTPNIIDHDTTPNTSVDHETTSNVSVDHETTPNVSVDPDTTPNVSENETSTSDCTDVEEREDLLKQLQLAQEDNARLRHYISGVAFMIMDNNPSLFEK